MNLSGGSTLAAGIKVVLQFLKDTPPPVIAPGQYLLVVGE